MRRTIAATVAVAACLTLGACSSSDQPKPKTATAQKPAEKTETPTVKKPTELALGKSAKTVGSGGTGVIEVTPTTVVYAKEGSGEKPKHDTFAVVTLKARPVTAADASLTAPISNGGFQYAAPDGQAISIMDGTATNVVMDSFNGGGDIAAGTFQWNSAVFDIADAQKGGTLIYRDGAGQSYRWKLPATDSGPQAAQVKKELVL